MTFVLLFNAGLVKKLIKVPKIYVKVSNFILEVNFSIFQKKLGNTRYALYTLL